MGSTDMRLREAGSAEMRSTQVRRAEMRRAKLLPTPEMCFCSFEENNKFQLWAQFFNLQRASWKNIPYVRIYRFSTGMNNNYINFRPNDRLLWPSRLARRTPSWSISTSSEAFERPKLHLRDLNGLPASMQVEGLGLIPEIGVFP